MHGILNATQYSQPQSIGQITKYISSLVALQSVCARAGYVFHEFEIQNIISLLFQNCVLFIHWGSC